MFHKLRYLEWVVMAITLLHKINGNKEMSVREIWAEAENQSSKVGSTFSAQAHGLMVKGMISLKNIGLLVFSRDDDDAGRLEDDNTVKLTPKGVDVFTQLGEEVVRGRGRQPRPEHKLKRAQLSQLHEARRQRFKRVVGRVPPAKNIIQYDRELRRLTRKVAVMEAQVAKRTGKGMDVEQDSPLSTDPEHDVASVADVATGPSDDPSGWVPTRASTPVEGGSDLCSPPQEVHVLSGPERTKKRQRFSPFSIATRPLRRTSNSVNSSFYGGLATPGPAGRDISGGDVPMDIDERPPIPLVLPTLDAISPCTPQTQNSNVHLAYPSPASAQRPNLVGRAPQRAPRVPGAGSQDLQTDPFLEPSAPFSNAVGGSAALTHAPLFSVSDGRNSPCSPQDLDATTTEGNTEEQANETSEDQATEPNSCVQCVDKQKEINELSQRIAGLVNRVKKHHEENGEWLTRLLSENDSA